MNSGNVADLEVEKLRKKVAYLEKEVDRLRKHNTELSERTLELYSLFELSYSLSSGVRYDRMAEDSMDFLGELLGIDQFSLLLFDEQDRMLHIKSSLGIPKEAARQCVIQPPEGIAGYVFSKGEALYVPDVSKESRYLYYKGFNPQGGSVLSLPLLDEAGKAFGVLNISKPEINGFSVADQARYGTLALQIAVIIQNYTFYRQLQQLSLTDELTGVSNRRAFFEELEKEHGLHQRAHKSYCLLLIDVDYFKAYNDTHGHLEGDLALKKLAKLLADRCRNTDHLARYGGEEFVVCAIRTTKEEGKKLAEALCQAIAGNEFLLGTKAVASPLTITVGLACYPEDGETYNGVLENADRALFYGKSSGRNTVAVYPTPLAIETVGVGATGKITSRRGKGTVEE